MCLLEQNFLLFVKTIWLIKKKYKKKTHNIDWLVTALRHTIMFRFVWLVICWLGFWRQSRECCSVLWKKERRIRCQYGLISFEKQKMQFYNLTWNYRFFPISTLMSTVYWCLLINKPYYNCMFKHCNIK